VLAPAKINLGLFVGPTRADGRHELVTVMQSISLADELMLERAPAGAGGDELDELVCPGVPGPAGENLAWRALAAFRAATGWEDGPLRVSVVKRIPLAGGLAGGSADAAATLRLAARASGLGDEGLLREIGAGLGADVPAQIAPGRWLATGAGEQLRALPAPGGPFGVLVIALAQGLSTAQVYAQADRMGLAGTGSRLADRREALLAALADGTRLAPGELLGNDLQDAARALCPEIDGALELARASGADAALVSGSGPTVLGLFAGAAGPERARRAADALAGRRPAAIAATPVGAEIGLPIRHNAARGT